MAPKEYIVGREGEIRIHDPRISRRHLKIIRQPDGIYLEDLDSTGGTWVNGKRIKKKKVSPDDRITLGADYTLDLQTCLQKIPFTDAEFSEEFGQLKGVYEQYNKMRVKIQSTTQGQMMLKRSIPMALPGVLLASASLFGNLGSGAAIIGGVLSAGAMVGGLVWGAKEQAKMPEKLNELDEQFKIDYSCPDCKKPFGQQNSWESLKRQGKCPFCRREFHA